MRKCLMVLLIASMFGCLAAAGIGIGGNAGMDYGLYGNLITRSMKGSSWNANLVWDSNLMQNDKRNFRVRICSGKRTSNYSGDSNIFEYFVLERVNFDMLSLDTTLGYHVAHGEHYRFWAGFNFGVEHGYASGRAWTGETVWSDLKQYDYTAHTTGLSLGMSLGWNIPTSSSWIMSLEFTLRGTIALNEYEFKQVDDRDENLEGKTTRENRIALICNVIPFYRFME